MFNKLYLQKILSQIYKIVGNYKKKKEKNNFNRRISIPKGVEKVSFCSVTDQKEMRSNASFR